MNITHLDLTVTKFMTIDAKKRLEVATCDHKKAEISGELKAYDRLERYFTNRLAAENRIQQGK